MSKSWRVAGVVLAMAVAVTSGTSSPAGAASGEKTQARISDDLAAGRPIVVHVIVALCDNKSQGIIPVPAHLGNGQDPESNLYWGALYGVRTYFLKQSGWISVLVEKPKANAIRERLLLFKQLTRGDHVAPVYVVADAWDGAEIKSAIAEFLAMAAGRDTERVSFRQGSNQITVSAGGASHLVAFVGHNGLMDFSVPDNAEPKARAVAGSSLVLACASKSYFLERLGAVGSHPLLLTTGLMAPEAYTLNAAIQSWAQGGSVSAVRDAAAEAYDEFQNCGRQAAQNLFWGQEP